MDIADLVEQICVLQTKIDLLTEATAVNKKKEVMYGDWIPESEMVALTGKCVNTLRKLYQNGDIRGTKFGDRENFYLMTDVKKLLDRNEPLRK